MSPLTNRWFANGGLRGARRVVRILMRAKTRGAIRGLTKVRPRSFQERQSLRLVISDHEGRKHLLRVTSSPVLALIYRVTGRRPIISVDDHESEDVLRAKLAQLFPEIGKIRLRKGARASNRRHSS